MARSNGATTDFIIRKRRWSVVLVFRQPQLNENRYIAGKPKGRRDVLAIERVCIDAVGGRIACPILYSVFCSRVEFPDMDRTSRKVERVA